MAGLSASGELVRHFYATVSPCNWRIPGPGHSLCKVLEVLESRDLASFEESVTHLLRCREIVVATLTEKVRYAETSLFRKSQIAFFL